MSRDNKVIAAALGIQILLAAAAGAQAKCYSDSACKTPTKSSYSCSACLSQGKGKSYSLAGGSCITSSSQCK